MRFDPQATIAQALRQLQRFWQPPCRQIPQPFRAAIFGTEIFISLVNDLINTRAPNGRAIFHVPCGTAPLPVSGQSLSTNRRANNSDETESKMNKPLIA